MSKHRTMQGKMIDMEKLMRQNETVPAVGNASMNARGDIIGQGGKIIKKREEVVAEYYNTNPNALKKAKPAEVTAPPAQVAPAQVAPAPVAPAPVAPQPVPAVMPASAAPDEVEAAPAPNKKKPQAEG